MRTAERGIIHRFWDRLPVSTATPVVTLEEGDTPLIHSARLSAAADADVWLKYEGLNPTGSFKDRGMTLAISKALEENAQAVVCASTGNTSASAAAYAARAGLTCGVIIPAGNVALGKLSQALMHGARVVQIDGNFDHALQISKELADRYPITLVNSVNRYRIEGQKTAAFEILERLGAPPDLHLMPVGNAGNITAYWKGYREMAAGTGPRMYGFQARGAAPLVEGHPIDNPRTIATAIRIGNPASWDGATEAAGSSGGAILAVSDTEIVDSYKELAREGLFVEPASAAGVAGLRRLVRDGSVPTGATVVCVLTGHGLKDPDTAFAQMRPPDSVPADTDTVAAALHLS
jgi:threonine synthase